MLFELDLMYTDGSKETTIIYAEHDKEAKMNISHDNVASSSLKRFKYKVNKHDYLPLCIARFVNSTVIFPEIMKCHPQTTLEDIEVSKL